MIGVEKVQNKFKITIKKKQVLL